MELKKSFYRLSDEDPELIPGDERLSELEGEPDDIDEMLAEIEERVTNELAQAEQQAKGQLELFGALLNDLAERKEEVSPQHCIEVEGRQYRGSWEEIVREMRD